MISSVILMDILLQNEHVLEEAELKVHNVHIKLNCHPPPSQFSYLSHGE